MSSLHHENILEECFEVAMESFRINNQLTHEQLDELITISAAMEDYINYDDELLEEDELIGGLSVANRVESIQDKIYKVLIKSTNKGEK